TPLDAFEKTSPLSLIQIGPLPPESPLPKSVMASFRQVNVWKTLQSGLPQAPNARVPRLLSGRPGTARPVEEPKSMSWYRVCCADTRRDDSEANNATTAIRIYVVDFKVPPLCGRIKRGAGSVESLQGR